jgi:hypothetical protein
VREIVKAQKDYQQCALIDRFQLSASKRRELEAFRERKKSPKNLKTFRMNILRQISRANSRYCRRRKSFFSLRSTKIAFPHA